MSTQRQSAPITLAHQPLRGLVRICPSDCIHVTYGLVTLDFYEHEHFEAFVTLLDEHREHAKGGMRVQHGNAWLSFSAEEFAEFSALAHQAAEELGRLNSVRKLLARYYPA